MFRTFRYSTFAILRNTHTGLIFRFPLRGVQVDVGNRMLAAGSRCLQRQAAIYVPALQVQSCRNLMTLAIETSCDDTSVAILKKRSGRYCNLLFHEKVTANNSAHRGIHPIVSLQSHQENLARLIDKALLHLPNHTYYDERRLCVGQDQAAKEKPDFISVTRGPGMRSNLTTGLDTAKGLAVAWQIPLVGVNHMQAHALTPRLVSMLDDPTQDPKPSFPYLSLLVSGGHTLLVHSREITEHGILATTTDLAIGDVIDKIARLVLPPHVLQEGDDVMYGRHLECFAFPSGEIDHQYRAPKSRGEEIARKESRWGWALVPPLAETRSGSKSKAMEFTFSGLGSAVKRICEAKPDMGHDERVDLAKESMRVAFEHLASRVGWALRDLQLKTKSQPYQEERGKQTLVVSGGVASNGYLKTILRTFLAARGLTNVKVVFPPTELCTDNAAMIAWTGMEMFERGWRTGLKCRAIKKWSVDPDAEEGGILGADCWTR